MNTQKIFLSLAVLCSLVLLTLGLQSDLFKAALFPGGTDSATQEIFIPSDFRGAPGDTGEIVVRSGTLGEDISGLSFKLSWDPDQISFRDISKAQTRLDRPDVFVQDDVDVDSGELSVIAVTGEMIGVSANDVLMRIGFEIADTLTDGDEIDLAFVNLDDANAPAEIVYEENGQLTSRLLSAGDGKILVSSGAQTLADESVFSADGGSGIALVASDDFPEVFGFEMTLQFNAQQAELVEASLADEFGDANFLLDTFEQSPGAVRMVVVGSEGVSVSQNDVLLNLDIEVNDDVALGTQIEFLFRDIEMVVENLATISVADQTQTLTVNEGGNLELQNVLVNSATELELEFSDYILPDANVSALQISPNIITATTVLTTEGKNIVLSNLAPQVPDQIYEVRVGMGIMGNVSGTISRDADTAFFSGFPATQNVSAFRVTNARAESDTEVLLTFSESVNENSAELEDFSIEELMISDLAFPAQNQILLTTSSQESVDRDVLVRIANANDQHDLKSIDGDLLSQNVFPLQPFGIRDEGIPRIVSAEFGDEDATITFDLPITGSSLEVSDVTISPLEGGNILTGGETISFSDDFTRATISPVETDPGVLYLVEIAEGSISADGTENKAIGSSAIAFGADTVFAPWEFALRSVSSTGEDTVEVLFSQTIENVITPLDMEIRDVRGNALTITNVEQDRRRVRLTTAVQQDTRYTFVADRSAFQNSRGQPLNASNSAGFSGFMAERPVLTAINPSDVINNSVQEIILSGNNLPTGSIVTVGGTNVTVSSGDAQSIVIALPEGFQVGNHEVQVTTPDGQILTAPENLAVRAPQLELEVLSAESFASPNRVLNDGNTETTLWVLISDPLRGVSDIDRVTADLRPFGGSPAASFTPESIVDNQQWFYLTTTVAASTAIQSDPYQIAVTAVNKSGDSDTGTVSVSVVNELEASNPPQILSATVTPESVAPGSSTPFRFSVKVTDPDGVDDISQVIVDLTPIGYQPTLLTALGNGGGSDGVFPDRVCTEDDFVLGQIGECSGGVQQITVTKKAGVECRDSNSVQDQLSIRDCTDTSAGQNLAICQFEDYLVTPGVCENGIRTNTVELRPGVQCEEIPGLRPSEQEQCTENTSFLDMLDQVFFPKAVAQGVSSGVAFYRSEEFTIPNYISAGTYQLPVTVTDRRGQVTEGIISFAVRRNTGGAPRIDKDDISITPSKSMVQDGVTKYSIEVVVTDPEGDAQRVLADLRPLSLGFKEMQRGESIGEKTRFFISDIIIPQEAFLGWDRIEFLVSDAQGNTAERNTTVEIVSPDDSPSDFNPEVMTDRGYMTPSSVSNDGQTRFAIYAFVEDRDGYEDIDYVTIELGNVAQFVGTTSSPFNPYEEIEDQTDPLNDVGGEESVPVEEEFLNDLFSFVPTAVAQEATSPNCVTTSSIVCLFPSVSEGANGRWFYLPDVVVAPSTPVPDDGEPYLLKVIATDVTGRKGEGIARVYVNDGNLPFATDFSPKLDGVVATERRTVEVSFSHPLPDENRITSDAFQIVNRLNTDEIFPIRAVFAAANNKIITLETNSMEGGEYTLIADLNKLLGSDKATFSSDRKDFEGYSKSKASGSRPPSAIDVEATGTKEVEVRFSHPLKPSSFDKSFFRISRADDDADSLPITHMQFGENASVVLLSTALQRSGEQYILQVKKGVENSYGIPRRNSIRLRFRGYTGDYESLVNVWNRADFNEDGKVDFVDFSLFGAVFGATENNSPGDMNGDGQVNFTDFTIFAAQFGTVPPPPPVESVDEVGEYVDFGA